MRVSRLIIAALALALLGLFPSTGASAGAAGSVASAAQAPATEITITGFEKRVNGAKRPFVRGSVNPPKGPVFIQKATQCGKTLKSCNWKPFSQTFLKDGRYVTRIAYPNRRATWVFRARVNGAVSGAVLTCSNGASCSQLP